MAEKTLKKENYNLDDVALVLVDICIQDDVAYRIVDQREITLCKDCKYWQTSKIKGGEGYHTCMKNRFGANGIIAFKNDFCSRGVKR